jgi:hypothetical protein
MFEIDCNYYNEAIYLFRSGYDCKQLKFGYQHLKIVTAFAKGIEFNAVILLY